MKIGILTLPFNNNYGGLLQAYSLQAYLKERGHKVYSIQQPQYNTKYKIKQSIKRLLKVGNYTNSSNMEKFQYKYMKETFPVKTDEDLNKLKKYEFDLLIVGSDQVWRFKYTKDKYKRYFFDFVSNEDIKKLSFAASFGIDKWEADKEQTKIAAKLIKRFDAVSVREKEGIDLCRDYLGYNDVVNLLDPTLLMPADFYGRLYNGKEISNKGKIGYYFLDVDIKKLQLLSDLENQLSLPSFIIGKRTFANKPRRVEIYYPPVSQWIKDFDTAEYIVTDSFHGMIFSIIFEKSFIVIGNKGRGLNRFTSFLSMFNLEDRLIDNDDYSLADFNKTLSSIDYSFSKKKINENDEKSDLFFKSIRL